MRLALPNGTAWLLGHRLVPVLVAICIVLQILALIMPVVLPPRAMDGRMASSVERVANVVLSVALLAVLVVLWQLVSREASATPAEGPPRGRTLERTGDDGGALDIHGQRFLDPFDIPPGLAGEIPTELLPRVFQMIEARYAHVIEEGFRDPDTRALLLCDGEVAARAATIRELPEERIREIERERGRICFLYSREDMFEECGWSALGEADAYPTLRVWLASEGAWSW